MSRFYNKVAPDMTFKVLKKVPRRESEMLVNVTCADCPAKKPTGVQQKHGSYTRYLNQLRHQVITRAPY